VFSEVVNRRQTFVFSATLTFVPTKPQRLEFAKKKKKKFHQITTKEKLGYFSSLILTCRTVITQEPLNCFSCIFSFHSEHR